MGRYYYGEGKNTVDEYKNISISFLQRYGYLKNPLGFQTGTLSWTRGGQENGNIGISVHINNNESYLRVNFTQTDREGNKKDFDYKILLVKTPCNYGGFRWWFVCPCKGNRCSILYLQSNGYFASRKTLNLCYQDQKSSKKWRAYGKVLIDNSEKILEIEKTIKYPYRNGKPTRKMKRVMKLEKSNLSEVEYLQLQKSLLYGLV